MACVELATAIEVVWAAPVLREEPTVGAEVRVAPVLREEVAFCEMRLELDATTIEWNASVVDVMSPSVVAFF